MTTTVFSARKIITMNPSLPEATHIAVCDGRILAVGNAESMAELARHQGDMQHDDRFADRVIMPGMVEGHSHAHEGALWQYLYLGYYPRRDPEGTLWQGIQDTAAMQARLRAAADAMPAGEPIIAWGFDPIFFGDQVVDRHALDTAVSDRPVVIVHLSFHAMTVNSAMIERAGLDRHTHIEGVLLDDQGNPTGSIKEMAAMHAIHESLGINVFDIVSQPDTLRRFGRAATQAGVTTATDLFNPLTDEGIQALETVTQEDDFPLRLVPAMSTLGRPIDEGIERLAACCEKSNPRLHFGLAKVMSDGSMPAFTCRMKWPHYHNGMPNGAWNASPEELRRVIQAYHQAGVHLQIHTNGDEAVELILDCLQEALELWPRLDHRHTLHHCQVADQAQMRRAKALGVCMNLLTNHLYYWGDVHADTVLGWERAQRLNPAASVLRHGIPLAIHSDAPVTPLGPLFTAHVACTRKTASGQLLGPFERIDVPQALEAVTLGAAYTLKLDHLVGSLEMGKYADMAVLDRDPLAGDGEALAEVGVVATMLGGRVHEA
ncbi:amidohydrolase [Halomonas sp. KAO]|uniref:amidohydrolase n=1 Tax=unclassified Halomonas TaxID=2609666 RepID=UPI00189D4904|nr:MULTISPECIES: amidohydrolase [unclassified Halomonas]MBF7054870.1 amidohydrolase [Halomonas sp. KAO]MDT0501533.1 amidohydrolase [Halomonas sp. PAR7]MDT0512785.1 amidohydrolase [Halomonas sp. LES1]MDT0591390.1 amidohydrolase [Halomonas sp. PAR8]